MTDGWLMDADCIHGVAWYECDECEAAAADEIANAIEDEVRRLGRGHDA